MYLLILNKSNIILIIWTHPWSFKGYQIINISMMIMSIHSADSPIGRVLH